MIYLKNLVFFSKDIFYALVLNYYHFVAASI
jgi:hypothetical protein